MTRRSRLLIFSLAACVPAVGLLVSMVPSASAASQPSASDRAHAETIARNFLRHLSVGWHPTDRAVGTNQPAISGLNQVQSTNWSGYANDNSSGNTYSAVSAKWTEPTGTCTSTTSLAAFWVGIDGYTSDSVEQDGTLIECYERSDTVAPQQALALANSKMSFMVAGLVAGHLGGEAPPAAAFVEKAFEAVLGRPPSPEELDLSQKFIEQEQERFRDPEKPAWQKGKAANETQSPALRAREDLVHVLLNHNDFVTVR